MSRVRESSGQAKVYWEDPANKTSLNYEGRTVTAAALRTLVQELIREGETLLWQKLLFTEDSEHWIQPNLSQINEHLSLGSSAANTAFLSMNNEEKVQQSLEFVKQRLLANAQAKEAMLATSGSSSISSRRSILRDSGVRQYKAHLREFLNKLFTLVHITGGAPARGTEIGSVRHRDGLTVDRNLFIIQGRVVFITQYHKGMLLSDKMKVIPRVLPSAVGALLTLYLQYVRPFAADIDLVHNRLPDSDYLWATSKGTAWETERMSKALSDCSERLIGVRLTIQSYRHIAVAFSRDVVHVQRPSSEQFRNFQLEEELLEEDEAEGDDAAALQTAHTQRLRVNHYAQSINNTARLTSRSLEVFTSVSKEWHQFLGLEIDQNLKDRQKGKQHKRFLSVSSNQDKDMSQGKFISS